MHTESDLGWCRQSNYSRLPKCTGKLSNDFNHQPNPSTESECESSIDAFAMKQQSSAAIITSGSSQPSRSHYELLAREMDANLAQMDIETFRTMDINHFLSDLNQKFDSSSLELESSNTLNCSVTDSFLCEIEMHTDKLISYINESNEKSSASSTLVECKSNQDKSSTVGISVDSLDLSTLEPRCAEVISRCRSHDKHRYRIAFEKSWHDAMNSSAMNDTLPTLTTDLSSRRKQTPSIANNRHTVKQSEHPLCRSYQAPSATSLSRLAGLMNRSAHSDLTTRYPNHDMSATITPNTPFMPIFNLAASTATTASSSNNDSTSAPTSLIKMFIQNRISPSSSGGLLSSYDDSPLESSLGNLNLPLGLTGPITNDINLMSEERRCAALELAKARQMQSSPITEEEDEDRSDREVQRKSKRFDHDESRPERQKRNIDFGLLQQRTKPSTCGSYRRSVSMEEFGNRGNSFAQLPGKSTPGNQTVTGLNLLVNNKVTKGSSRKMNSRECSVSSGYLSGGTVTTVTGVGPLSDWSRKAQMTRTQTGFALKAMEHLREASVQTPPLKHDKQVQTSLDVNSLTSQPQTPSESNTEKSPIYVYYPNYSLPDLQFVQQLAPMSVELLPDLHLSPTRLQTAVQNISNPTPRTRFGRRPKSCGEFEQLSKEQFKHIQDWESLTTLLPKELQLLVKNLKLDVDDDVKSEKRTDQHRSAANQENQTSNPLYSFNRLQSMQRIRKVNSLDSNLCKALRCDYSTPFTPPSHQPYCPSQLYTNPIHCHHHQHLQQQQQQQFNCSHSNYSPSSCRLSGCVKDSQCTLRQSTTNRVCTHSTCNDSTLCANRSCGSCNSNYSFAPSSNSSGRPRGLVKSATMNLPTRCNCTPIPSSACCNSNHSQHSTPYFNCSSAQSYGTPRPGTCSTPITPCDPIREQVEEFDNVDLWLEQQNATDFDEILKQLDQPITSKPKSTIKNPKSVESKSNAKSKLDKQTSFDLHSTKDKPNSFSAIRSRWESLGSKQPQTTSTRSKVAVQAKIDTGIRSNAKRRARSKSPPKSNKEVVIVTKKEPSTLKSGQKVSNANSATVVTRQGQMSTNTSGQARRPKSFHNDFKSLIPVSRNKIKSPNCGK